MKLAIKWFLIGLVSTSVVLFILMLSNQLSRGGDAGISVVLTSHSYEALIGMIAVIGYTAGLALIIPTIIIGLIGFFVERIIKRRQVGTIMN